MDRSVPFLSRQVRPVSCSVSRATSRASSGEAFVLPWCGTSTRRRPEAEPRISRARSGITVHAGCVEPIFEAVLANDPSRITAAAAAQRMEEDLFVAELYHMLYRGDTPLHLAAAGLRYDAARVLLAAGTPVNAVNRRGATSLHYACDPRPLSPTWDPGAQRRIIELLVSAAATVDQPDRGGVTPLHRAVRARSPAAVAALLSAGADPHAATSKAGSTPLHLAVAPTGASGTAGAGDLQLEIVRMLLAAGATMADVDGNGVAVADRIQSQALRDALAAGQLLSPGLANVSRVRHVAGASRATSSR